MDKSGTEVFSEILKNAMETHPLFKGLDPKAANELTASMMKSVQAMYTPGSGALGDWAKNWMSYQNEMAKLWLKGLAGKAAENVEPSKDPRFHAEDWNEGIYPFLRQSYELTAKAMADMADKAGLPPQEQRKLSFYTRVAADALSPSNYALTNPEVIKLAQETNGQSLVDGFKNLLADLEKGYISTTDETVFEVGKNLATTPGAVVFRNELIELIQYEPVTPKIRENPILIVPPCVNKFYIFDLNERKSMIRYMLEQGNAVYSISWRNAGAETHDYGWDEYLEKGVFAALDVCADISKADKIDLLSWCNGGSMLLAALAVMSDAQKAQVGSATFLSSLIDFTDPGEVQVFLDKPQAEAYTTRLKAAKVAPGRDIARAMAMLHVNESIWGFVVNNYLKGKSPPPFDVLYWNSDTSNLPAKWFSYYTEEMYIANKLKEPGALTLLGKPVDTRTIDVPCYFLAATSDHIVPWKTSFTSTRLVSGETEFVLTMGGHVSGTVINHPERNRRYFLTDGDTSGTAEEWQASAKRTEGSWWPHWLAWLDDVSGSEERRRPQSLGNRKYPEQGPAPGTYVLEKVAQDG